MLGECALKFIVASWEVKITVLDERYKARVRNRVVVVNASCSKIPLQCDSDFFFAH